MVSRRAAGLALDAEKMAVVVQDVTGERHDGRFYPTLSALARSYNHYPVPGNSREDGVVSLTGHLGTFARKYALALKRADRPKASRIQARW